ncbi:hypothetical protein ABZP36_000135 [Zizania latifolia]
MAAAALQMPATRHPLLAAFSIVHVVLAVLHSIRNPSLTAPFFLLASSASSSHPLPADAYNAVLPLLHHDLAALEKDVEEMPVLGYGLPKPHAPTSSRHSFATAASTTPSTRSAS